MPAIHLKILGLLAVLPTVILCNGCTSPKVIEEPHPAAQRMEKQLPGGGTVVFYGYYKDGKVVEHGDLSCIEKDGSRFEMHYNHGIIEGKCRWYYPDGSLGFEGTYRHGKPWKGVLAPTDITGELPHKYILGIDCGIWKDPKGIYVDE